jgi:hypothetical protein
MFLPLCERDQVPFLCHEGTRNTKGPRITGPREDTNRLFHSTKHNSDIWYDYKVNVKLSLCFNWALRHEGVLGSGGIAPRILHLGTRWRWVVGFTPRPLYPQGETPWYPLDMRLAGTQSRSGRGGKKKNSQPLPGLELPIIQPVAQRYTTELSRFPLCVIKHHSMKYWGSGGIAWRINVGTGWRWVVRVTPQWLYPRDNRPRNTLDMRLGGPLQPVWTRSCRERYPAPAGNRTPVAQPVAQ